MNTLVAWQRSILLLSLHWTCVHGAWKSFQNEAMSSLDNSANGMKHSDSLWDDLWWASCKCMAESWDTKKGCQVTGSCLTQVYECNEAEAYCAMRQAGESWRKVEKTHLGSSQQPVASLFSYIFLLYWHSHVLIQVYYIIFAYFCFISFKSL